MQASTRLIALGAASAILIAACSSGGAASQAPASAAPASQPPASQAPASQAPASQAPASAPASAAASQAINTNWKACVAFDTGGLGDKGFNDLAMKGLNDLKNLGYQTAFSEAKSQSDYDHNIQILLDQGCQSITTVGFNQATATVKATLANPDVAFSQVDTTWDTSGPDKKFGTADDTKVPDNFTGLDFEIDQAAMLAGYVAAGFSKSGKIGTYGGQQFPGVTRFMDGLAAGVKYYNQKHGASVQVLGWDAAKQTGTFINGSNPWNDPQKGEQLAKTFLDQGVDIVWPVSGGTGNGTIKAMMNAGKWALGVDNDQAITLAQYAPAIITSAQKLIDAAVVATVEKNSTGDLGGDNYEGTLANGGVTMSPFHDFDSQIPADIKAEADQLKSDIASGKIKVADYLK